MFRSHLYYKLLELPLILWTSAQTQFCYTSVKHGLQMPPPEIQT